MGGRRDLNVSKVSVGEGQTPAFQGRCDAVPGDKWGCRAVGVAIATRLPHGFERFRFSVR